MTHQGTVKFYDPEKGYGFILINGTGPDIFVHHTGIDQVNSGSLLIGDQVQFEIEYDHRKDKEQAVNVLGGTGPVKGAGKGANSRGDALGSYNHGYY